MESKELFIIIGQTFLAAFGSLVRWLTVKDIRKQTVLILISDMSAAMLSGIIVYLFFYRYMQLDLFLCFCLAAILGLGGAEGVRKLEVLIYRKTGMDDAPIQHKEDEETKNGRS